MAQYDRVISQGILAAQRMEAIIASEQIEGIVQAPVVDQGTGPDTSDSELSTVSSSRYSGLEEDWWKEQAPSASKTLENTKAPEAPEALEHSNSRATVTVMRTRSKDKQVHWE
jgi:hypothetical protein